MEYNNFLKISGSDTIYPYDIKEYIHNQLTQYSHSYDGFERETIESLSSSSIYVVLETEIPSYEYTQVHEEGQPTLSGSVYVQTWNIVDRDSDDLQNEINGRWDYVRNNRNRLLNQSDWTQFQDSPITGSKLTEWQSYRQSLRDITSQSNPFEVTWPTKPE